MSGPRIEQVLQIVGALLVLSGFALAQARVVSDRSFPYLAVNLVGSGILAVLAALGRQWGFLLLEGAWAIISAVGVIRLLIRPPASTGGADGPTMRS